MKASFIQADGTPTSQIFSGGKKTTTLSAALSHIKWHGTMNGEGLDGDKRFPPKTFDLAKYSVFWQELDGGALHKLEQNLIEKVIDIHTTPGKDKLFNEFFPKLVKMQKKSDYTQEMGKDFLKEYGEMNEGVFITPFRRNTYMETDFVATSFVTKVCITSKNPEDSTKTWPENNEMQGYDLAKIGVDKTFKESFSYRPLKMTDMNLEPISQEIFKEYRTGED